MCVPENDRNVDREPSREGQGSSDPERERARRIAEITWRIRAERAEELERRAEELDRERVNREDRIRQLEDRERQLRRRVEEMEEELRRS